MPRESDGLDFSVTVPPGYRDREVLAFLTRDSEAIAEQVTPTLIRKGIVIDGTPTLLDLERQGLTFRGRVLADGRLTPGGTDLIHVAVMGMLGLRVDPEPFEAAFQDDVWLGPVIQRQAGLRIPQAATAFEALTWAIMGQQINVSFAVTLRRALIRLADRQHSSGLWCYPDAASVAQLQVEALMQRQFSRAKAETLIRVARMVESGELPLDDWQRHLPADAEAALLAIKGIGPWTAHYTLLRGFGAADCSLHGDAAVRSALYRVIGGPTKLDAPQVQRLLERYRPYRSLAAAHLWASLHVAA